MVSFKKILFNLVVYILIFTFSLLYIFMFLIEAWKRRNKPKVHISNDEPSCLFEPSLGKHGDIELKNVEKMNIHYVANGSRDKPLMLFLHGFPEFWYVWKYQLPEFGKDFYAVAVDMPGYGKSSCPTDLNQYTTGALANAVKEVVHELGYESCVLVGHDWGGAIAYVVANDHPEVVNKLIVLNCPHGRAFQKRLMSFKQLLASSYMFFFQLPYIPNFVLSADNCACLDSLSEPQLGGSKNISNEDIAAYKYVFRNGGFEGPLNYYRNIFSVKNFKMKFKTLEMPSLIIWGTEDLALNVELAEMSAKYIRDCRVKYVDGASHWVNIDEPEVVNGHMREFLQETLLT